MNTVQDSSRPLDISFSDCISPFLSTFPHISCFPFPLPSWWPSIGLASIYRSLSCQGTPKWIQYSREGLTGAEQTGIIISFNLPATLPLTHIDMWLPLPLQGHTPDWYPTCWVLGLPGFLAILAPTCPAACGYYTSTRRYCICLCWTSSSPFLQPLWMTALPSSICP